MFGFRKSPADRAKAIMPAAIRHAAGKWAEFRNSVAFKADVGLVDQIAVFLVPITQGLRNKFDALKNAPDTIFVLIVAMAVEESGTHSREEIEKSLKVKLPGK